MTPSPPLPGPCTLCGGTDGIRRDGVWACAVCGWAYGDAPDPELQLPRIDVVYYLAAHIAALRAAGEPWGLYARWLSTALRG